MKTLRALVRMGDPPWSRVAGSVALGALTVIAGVGLMSLAGYLISRAAEHPPVLSLTISIVAVRAFGIGRPVARYFERLRSHGLAFQVLARMRVACYRRIEPLIPSRSIGPHQGDLLASVVGDVDSMQSLFLRGMSPPAVAAVAGVVVVGVVAAFLPAAALVLAAGLVLGGVVVPAVAAVAGRHSRRQAAIRADLTVELVEVLRGAPELVVLGAGDGALQRIRCLDREIGRLQRRDALIGGAIETMASLVKGLTVVGVLLVCVHAAADGALDRTLVAALTLATMAAFEAVEPLPAAALGLRSTIEAGLRLLSLGAGEHPPTDRDHPAALPSDTTAALERVDFDHAADESWELRDVDLRLAPGRRVALTGHSGSGKSTVAALLVRFLDPDGGRVTLGGAELRDLRRHDVRATVTLDSQDGYLFSTTIRENVRLARPAATDHEIEAALRRARIWNWVESLPDGWDTFVGEEGARVSGGERRRISLARTLLADSPVMVLDEPTAHLDPPTGERLMADVLAGADGRSVLLITHRSEGLEAVDDVLSLTRGRVEPSVSSRPGDALSAAGGVDSMTWPIP